MRNNSLSGNSQENQTPQKERLSIPTDSGPISGTLWLPDGEPTVVIIIHPATATPEHFYTGLASYITSRGLVAVTYDYRGTGASGDPRKFKDLRMRNWMDTDVPTVSAWVRKHFPKLSITAIGHSVGGHAMVLGYGTESMERFAVVSSHQASTKKIPALGERLRVALILNVVGPVLSKLLGYMPGKKLGLGEDIPSAAMIEWGVWARRPRYFFDDPSMDAPHRAASVTQQVLAIGASDDPWASPSQMEALTSNLTSATVERRTYTPAELGVSRIGHHGLLRRRTGEKVWPELIDWLISPGVNS